AVGGTGAARRLGAKLASFIGLAEVLFAIGFAWVLLGQLPSAVQFLGGAFILAGVTLVRVDELSTGPAAGRPETRARELELTGARPGPRPSGFRGERDDGAGGREGAAAADSRGGRPGRPAGP